MIPATQAAPYGAAESAPTEEAARDRLVAALIRSSAEHGYANTSVHQVTRFAGLDPEDFYAVFADRGQCLLAAHEVFFDRLIDEVADECRTAGSWPEQVRAAVRCGLELLSEKATLARAFVVEALWTGPAAHDRHHSLVERLAEALRGGRERFPRAAAHPDSLERILVGGCLELIGARLLAEETVDLPDLEAELTELLLAPYVGGAVARAAAGTQVPQVS